MDSGPRAGFFARLLSHVTFGVLAALSLGFTAQVCFAVLTNVDKPFSSFAHTEEGFVNPTSLGVWGAEQAGLRAWDRIVAVDGEVVFGGEMIRSEALSGAVPRDVVYEVEGLEGERRFHIVPSRIFTPSDLIKSHASQALLGLAFVVIALLLYFLRPGTLEAWSFFAFFASVGVCMAAVVNETMIWRFPPLYHYVAPFMSLFGLVLVGALSKAFTWRKEHDPAGVVLRRAMWGIAIGATLVSAALAFAYDRARGDIHSFIVVDKVLYAWLATGTFIGLGALIITYRRGRSPRRRARIRQILWAIPVGAGIPSLNLLFGTLFDESTISFLWTGFVIVLPLSTADAIVRHDLLHLNITARRLVGGITVAALMGMGLGFVLWAAANFLNLNDAAGTVALAALLFAVAAPVTHRVQSYVESLLRSRRYDARRLLADFTARASTARHLPQLVHVLGDTLRRSVEPSRFELFRLDPGDNVLHRELGSDAIPLVINDAIAGLLKRADCSIFDDEQPPPAGLGEAALALRLAVAGQPVGLLVLHDRGDELAYEGPDVAFVESLAGPLAAALVSAWAYEEIEALNQDLERRVMERTAELEEKNHELAELNRRKDELVATVSHDFRSPLATIRQNVQTMLRDLTHMDAEDLKDFLEGVGRQEARLTSMCESLLDLARLKETGRVYTEEVLVDEQIEGVLEGFRLRADRTGVALSLEVDPDAPLRIAADPPRLGQVIQNLVDNAIKFSPRDGAVRVRLSRAATSLIDGAPTLEIDIEDTGCGIPAGDIPRLFEPFFQVPRQSHAGQGSGLGLAIVKAVIDAHGGRIAVESQEGHGTAFRIHLPALADAPEEPRAELADTAAPPPAAVDSGASGASSLALDPGLAETPT